jgi:DNA ligase (NAD+)
MSGILAKHFGSIEKLRSATEEELSNINEVGTIIAQNVFHFFRTETALIDDLIDQHVCRTSQSNDQKAEDYNTDSNIDSKNKKATLFDSISVSDNSSAAQHSPQHLPFQDMTIVVTGILEHFKRNEIEEVLEKHGGRVSSSVSSKTTFVLVGAEPGSKLAKAEKLGIRIVYEPEFLEMLKQ